LNHITQAFALADEKQKYDFTGDVLPVISLVIRPQEFAKLLKPLSVGA